MMGKVMAELKPKLAVRDVAKKGGVLVGFHEKRSSYVADMRSCLVLPPRISALLVPLRALVESLCDQRRPLAEDQMTGGRDRIGQNGWQTDCALAGPFLHAAAHVDLGSSHREQDAAIRERTWVTTWTCGSAAPARRS